MFKGSFVALITPFRNGRRRRNRLPGAGVLAGRPRHARPGAVRHHRRIAGTRTMTSIAASSRCASRRQRAQVPVIAGTGTNSTDHTIALTRAGQGGRRRRRAVVCPYYNKPTQEGLYQHFKAVHDAVDLPIVIYNIPGRSAVDMTNATMARLAKLPNIVGVKDATNDLARPLRMRVEIDGEFALLSGEDATAVAYLAQGGDGCISVTANVAPGLLAEMHEAWQKGEVATVRRINERLIALHDALFAETSPAPVKYAASLLGKCEPTVRQPLWQTMPETQERVARAMRGAGLFN